ncbi:MAG: DTW domain-containing protein [Archangium sp.]
MSGERTRVVLIQHVLELSQRSNTGRHASGVVPSLDVRVFGAQGAPLRVDDLRADQDVWLLWPGGDTAVPVPKPRTLVVLDGSWSQARKMMQRVPELRKLPQWCVPPREGRVSLRAAPDGGMSSLEAMAAAIELLDGVEAAAPVHAAHEALVQKQLRERGYVGPMK